MGEAVIGRFTGGDDESQPVLPTFPARLTEEILSSSQLKLHEDFMKSLKIHLLGPPTMVDLTYFVYPIDLVSTAFVPFDELANCLNPVFVVSLESF